MSKDIEAIKKYIQTTEPVKLPLRTAQHYAASMEEVLLLAARMDTPANTVALCIEYGCALGLRMGRKEAQAQHEREAIK